MSVATIRANDLGLLLAAAKMRRWGAGVRALQAEPQHVLNGGAA